MMDTNNYDHIDYSKDDIYTWLKQHKQFRIELGYSIDWKIGYHSPTGINPDEAPGGYSPPKYSVLNTKIVSTDEKVNVLNEIESIIEHALKGYNQAIVRMFYVEDKPMKDIASKLHLQYQTIDQYKMNAVNELVEFINSNKVYITIYNNV